LAIGLLMTVGPEIPDLTAAAWAWAVGAAFGIWVFPWAKQAI